MQLIELGYPLGVNFRIDTGGGPRFGNSDALIIHFRTPAADPSGSATFSVIYRGGSPQVRRVAALSTVPCVFPTAFALGATTSQGPVFNTTMMGLAGRIQLLPNTDYYITVVNRSGFGGSPSCPAADCPVFVDSN